MNNLLNKFDTIEIKPIDKITEEDRKFCEMHEKIYKQAHNAYTESYQKIKSIYDIQKQEEKTAKENGMFDRYDSFGYISDYGDCGIHKIEDELVHITRRFISQIMGYFSNKYSIKLDTDSEFDGGYNSYHDNPTKLRCISLEYILEKYLFPQMDGYSFVEFAVKQIKNKALTQLRWDSYRKYWNYEVKGKTIKFKMNINDIKPALYYYDSGETKIIDCYMYQRVSDYKHYENGNSDIKFISAEYALDFAKRYLGYIEMTEEEREEYKNKSRW